MKRRAINLAALAAAGLCAAGSGLWAYRRQAGADASFWSLRFDTPGGEPLALASFRGRPLVLNFWATWCAPCVKEMPQLDRFHREFGSRGWSVVGVALDSADKVKTFLAKLPVGFPIALGGMEGFDLARMLGNAKGGLPFTAVFDGDGRQIGRKEGETSYEELLAWNRQSG